MMIPSEQLGTITLLSQTTTAEAESENTFERPLTIGSFTFSLSTKAEDPKAKSLIFSKTSFCHLFYQLFMAVCLLKHYGYWIYPCPASGTSTVCRFPSTILPNIHLCWRCCCFPRLQGNNMSDVPLKQAALRGFCFPFCEELFCRDPSAGIRASLEGCSLIAGRCEDRHNPRSFIFCRHGGGARLIMRRCRLTASCRPKHITGS